MAINSVQTKDDILEILRSRSADIQKFGARRVGLFGSFSRNESKPESDIDFIVEFDTNKKNYDNFIRLAFFLEDATGRKIELLTPESINSSLKSTIESEVEYVSFV